MSVVQNNLYTYKNSGGSAVVSIAPPPGSIMAFLGATDPDGWIICNATVRTDGADGRYNNLIAMGIGSGTANATNYTPPDYRGAFLRGTGNPAANANYAGPGVNVSQTDAVSSSTSINTTWLYGTQAGSGINMLVTQGTGGGVPNTQSTVVSSVPETRPYNYGVNWILKL